MRLIFLIALGILSGCASKPSAGVDETPEAVVDTACQEETWYVDVDGDGVGGDEDSMQACSAPSGHVASAGDCDDTDPSIHPGAEEVCDGADNDCDDRVDERGATGTATWYGDADGDGYGDATVALTGCAPVSGYVADATDCDDGEPAVNPGEIEICEDGVDNDCSGSASDCPRSGAYELADSPYKYDGMTDDDRAGATVAWAEGLNGDGCAGLLIGARTHQNTGAVFLICDVVPGRWNLETATARLLGAEEGGATGATISSLGDFDEDGYPDVAVNEAGQAYVVSGPLSGDVSLVGAASLVVQGQSSGDSAGAPASAGDNNGDGHLDISFTAAGGDPGARAGAAYLLFGPQTGLVTPSQADAMIVGETDDEAVSRSIGVGDMDGDGLDDLLLAVPDHAEVGAVYVVLGPSRGVADLGDADWKLDGEYDVTGVSLRTVRGGDLNQDGYDDALVGSDYYNDHDGGVFVLHGPPAEYDRLTDAPAVLVGPASPYNAYAGNPANAGDVNADGIDDIVVGGPVWTTDVEVSGAAFVVYGPASGKIDLGAADVTWEGEYEYGGAGVAVSSAGDVDDDGCADLLIGSVLYYEYRGHAYVATGCAW